MSPGGRDALKLALQQGAPDGVQKFLATGPGSSATYREALRRLRSDEAFRDSISDALAACPFAAFRWETPGVDRATAERTFEFVLVDAPELLVEFDPSPFAEHFREDGHGIVTFDNLGGDATLVVPSPRGPESAYGHLAAFVRGAPRDQVHALWSRIGELVLERLSDEPLWLSTAGGGVSWLHVRLDSRPKYYAYAPYRSAPG